MVRQVVRKIFQIVTMLAMAIGLEGCCIHQASHEEKTYCLIDLTRASPGGTVRSAPWDTTQTRSASGSSMRWTPTTLRRGQKAERRTSRIARCYAGRTTEQRGIGDRVAT